MTEQQVFPSKTKPALLTAKPGTKVIVDVFATTKPDGRVEFAHEWRWGENGPSEGNGTIHIPKRLPSEPGTPMQFHLRDETNPKRELVFSDNQGATMWVLRDTCPPGEERCDDPQIPPDQMDTAPKLLKAFNMNSEKCNLHYRLWFKDKDGQTDSYDPDITNGGKS
jgi:hypothetical protein